MSVSFPILLKHQISRICFRPPLLQCEDDIYSDEDVDVNAMPWNAIIQTHVGGCAPQDGDPAGGNDDDATDNPFKKTTSV